MQLAYSKPSLEFELHIRCENCMRESVRAVTVPGADDAPRDVDELLESVFLSSLRYSCQKCQSPIGRLFAVMPLGAGY